MNWFERIIIAIVIIIFAVTPAVYSLDIRVIWAVILDLEANSIAAIASATISGLIFITTVWQIWQNHNRNKLLVKPLLSFKNVDGQDEQNPSIRNFKIVIVNKGIGPALIKSSVMLFHNKIVKIEDYYNFFIEKLQELDSPIAHHITRGSVIKAEEEIVLIGFDYTSYKEKNDFINKLEFHIEYQSIYEDKTVPLSAKFGSGFNFQETDTESNFISKEMALIHEDCFAKHDRWSEQVFAKYLKDPKIVFVIQSPDSPNSYGFALGQHLDDEQTELLTLAVLSHEQGKGRGYDLLNEFIAGVKKQGRKSIFLEVAKNNAPALHLYKKAGFKRVGLRPAYYKVPNAPAIDAILMRLDIQTP